MWIRRVLFFFFQAEDGIRDWSVTGVQTCALPISGFRPARRHRRGLSRRCRRAGRKPGRKAARWLAHRQCSAQIGRASCRERVEISVGSVSLKKEKEVRGEREQSE